MLREQCTSEVVAVHVTAVEAKVDIGAGLCCVAVSPGTLGRKSSGLGTSWR